MKTMKTFNLITGISCYALAVFAPEARATCQEGCDIAFGNTFLGDDALGNDTGNSNTAIGDSVLADNTTGNENTASGAFALGFNTTGSFNTASGAAALRVNGTGNNNTASGSDALFFNTTGSNNTASGANSLQSNTTGGNNTASGYQALNMNTIGADNVAAGYQALLNNTSGLTNTAVGAFALVNSQTGTGNIAIGFNAGSGVTSGNNNIDIANNGADESSTIRIGSSNQTATFVAGIRGVGVAGGQPVGVTASGQLGVRASSARFKEGIKAMGDTSEAILDLKPVTFRYKKEFDPKRTPQFGLVAEEVAKVNPDLVMTDEQGKAFTVRYDEVNAMLLNEFLKEHRKVEEQTKALRTDESEIARLKSDSAMARRDLKFELAEQRQDFEARIAQQQKQIGELTAGLQKVSARLESSPSSAKVVADN
jgi:Chaperone of endosialidase